MANLRTEVATQTKFLKDAKARISELQTKLGETIQAPVPGDFESPGAYSAAKASHENGLKTISAELELTEDFLPILESRLEKAAIAYQEQENAAQHYYEELLPLARECAIAYSLAFDSYSKLKAKAEAPPLAWECAREGQNVQPVELWGTTELGMCTLIEKPQSKSTMLIFGDNRDFTAKYRPERETETPAIEPKSERQRFGETRSAKEAMNAMVSGDPNPERRVGAMRVEEVQDVLA